MVMARSALEAIGGLVGLRPRRECILGRLDRRGHGLEIGPSHRPVAPKSEGFDVKIMDCQDREGLIRMYRDLGVDSGRIEEVDYVWRGERYSDLVGGENLFDWIISSHSLEHIPDMAGFLLDCKRILKPGGILALALPNQECMFDHERMPSSLASVIDAHLRKDAIPTPGTVAEFNLMFSKKGGLPEWGRFSPRRLLKSIRVNTPDTARSAFRAMQEDPKYLDVHVWCFTPRSFQHIVDGLVELAILEGMELIARPMTRRTEFFAFLRKSG